MTSVIQITTKYLSSDPFEELLVQYEADNALNDEDFCEYDSCVDPWEE